MRQCNESKTSYVLSNKICLSKLTSKISKEKAQWNISCWVIIIPKCNYNQINKYIHNSTFKKGFLRVLLVYCYESNFPIIIRKNFNFWNVLIMFYRKFLLYRTCRWVYLVQKSNNCISIYKYFKYNKSSHIPSIEIILCREWRNCILYKQPVKGVVNPPWRRLQLRLSNVNPDIAIA